MWLIKLITILLLSGVPENHLLGKGAYKGKIIWKPFCYKILYSWTIKKYQVVITNTSIVSSIN